MSVIYSAKGISKRFGAVQALDNVDFDVIEGKVNGLVGANGAGKSTLLKIIAGAMPPDAGELRLDGKPLTFSSIENAARSGIAIVSQELSLFPALTVEENLLLAPGARTFRARRAFGRRARTALDRLGVNVPFSAPLYRLSLCRSTIDRNCTCAVAESPRAHSRRADVVSARRRSRAAARHHSQLARFRHRHRLRQPLPRGVAGDFRQSRRPAQRSTCNARKLRRR